MKKIFLLFVSVFMICIISGCSITEEEILITSQSSPDNNYTIFLYQVGTPQWSFGSVSAKLVLKDFKGKKIDEENFGLANDGGPVTDNNIVEIIWLDDKVEIEMKEFDTTQQYTYILNYSN